MHEIPTTFDWCATARMAGVIVLLAAAAVTAAPPGRLPLALRGLKKILAGDGGAGSAGDGVKTPAWKRLAAFLLTAAAALLAVW